MRILPCSYCSAPVYPGHGIMFVRNDAKCFRFCGSKCKTHFKVRHHPRKSKWTKTHRRLAGKELVNDSVLNFEKIRSSIPRYNRDLYIKTIKAIDTIQRIKRARQTRLYLERIRNAQNKMLPSLNKMLAAKALKKTSNLLKTKLKQNNRQLAPSKLTLKHKEMN